MRYLSEGTAIDVIGRVLTADTVDSNGRLYPAKVLEDAVAAHPKELIIDAETGSPLKVLARTHIGHVDHPGAAAAILGMSMLASGPLAGTVAAAERRARAQEDRIARGLEGILDPVGSLFGGNLFGFSIRDTIRDVSRLVRDIDFRTPPGKRHDARTQRRQQRQALRGQRRLKGRRG